MLGFTLFQPKHGLRQLNLHPGSEARATELHFRPGRRSENKFTPPAPSKHLQPLHFRILNQELGKYAAILKDVETVFTRSPRSWTRPSFLPVLFSFVQRFCELLSQGESGRMRTVYAAFLYRNDWPVLIGGKLTGASRTSGFSELITISAKGNFMCRFFPTDVKIGVFLHTLELLFKHKGV